MNSLISFLKRISVFLFFCFLMTGLGVVRASDVRIALVLDKGGKDDKSFNSAAYQGVMRVKDELKIFVKYVEATDDNAFYSLLRSFAQKKFNLIIAVGVSQTEAIKKVAGQFPDEHFAIVDGEVLAPNVRSMLFQEQEGSFVVGAIAAHISKTGAVGFIGGMDIPLIRRFQLGFEAGAKHFNPRVKVISNYIGMTADAWNNPARAKELAVAQYDAGADVIFGAAGASGTGLFDAAEEKKKFAIGVDSNQNWVKPGYILTSMVKHVDQAVYMASKDTAEGRFIGGVERFGLANQGVGYTVDSFNEKILPLAVRRYADELKSQIISGQVQVPDYYRNKKK